MPKYYYDCPIEAAYMADKFSVNFCYDYTEEKNVKFPIYCNYSQETDDLDGGFIETTYLHDNIPVSKFHIHPDSEQVFEPQVGDVIHLNHQGFIVVQGSDGYPERKEDFFEGYGTHPLFRFDIVRGGEERIEILKRNGKPFIWPKEGV